MATLVSFHAHPDDEAIVTGGTIARASAEGHRVVLVIATDGACGQVPDDLADDETLADRRRAETDASAAALGVHRVEFLGYADSGMNGWEQNGADGSFWSADVDAAASRLADVLRDEGTDVLTIYDWHGGYGHPDHIQVHRVGCRAEELVRRELPDLRVFESTLNRDELRRGLDVVGEMSAEEAGLDDDFDPDAPMDDGNPMGTPEAELTLGVDVADFVEQKRSSIAAHRSQVSESSFFVQMSDEIFAQAFGREWYIEHGRPAGLRMGWIFDTA